MPVAIAVAMLALVVRLFYVQHFAVPMPFWDQWDAEGAFLLKPWIDGTFPWADLIRTHNEHRILPTRLVTLATYLVTGQWNNMYEARVAALVFCLIPGMLVWQSLRQKEAGAHRWLLVVAALLLSVLPFAWENFLVGFQSQFYFLVLFSLCAIRLAATQHENILVMATVVALSILATLTMASGLFTLVAVAGTYVLACLCLPGRRWPALCTTAVLAALACYAYLKLPIIPEHRTLQAQNAHELVDAISHVLGWPLVGPHWAIAALWLPCIVYIARMVVLRRATRTDLSMAGLCAWSALQGLAIAYGRGHGLDTPAARYTELFTPGLFGNAWFALRLWNTEGLKKQLRAGAQLLALAFAGTFLVGMLIRVPMDARAMTARHDAARLQEKNTLLYLTSGDPAALEVNAFEIPYPNASRLRGLLDDPALKNALYVEVVPAQQKNAAPAQQQDH
ncbi:hypothetical protein [Stenotrophomonas indicatrix]|uniref:hypothetical protein n=1 Tax=Stenotrophomonas indicatrix TaxID=2045451 RepID=UPI0028AA2034|nr:hypothetical protein [Stenotrophomonas indicatrix]